MIRSAIAALLCLLASASPLLAQEAVVLSLDDALQRARESAPAVLAARSKIEEARARLRGAALPVASNPRLEIEVGQRNAGWDEYELAVAQEIEPRRLRRFRIDAATAGVDRELQRVREVQQQVQLDVASTYLRALQATALHEIAANANALSQQAREIAERRYAAGDVAQLDVNLARTAEARSEAEMLRASSFLRRELVELQVLLALPDPPEITGSLADHNPLEPERLIASAADRPELRMLDAAIAEAEAERRIAQTLSWPEMEVLGSYAREEGDQIATAGVGLSLPVFNRGKEQIALAKARLSRLVQEREALMMSIGRKVRGGIESYSTLRQAASRYQTRVLPLIDENEQLALESYELGQIGLADLLLVRREALDARAAWVEHLAAMRLEELQLRAETGVWK